jgi:hypothetical protein
VVGPWSFVIRSCQLSVDSWQSACRSALSNQAAPRSLFDAGQAQRGPIDTNCKSAEKADGKMATRSNFAGRRKSMSVAFNVPSLRANAPMLRTYLTLLPS